MALESEISTLQETPNFRGTDAGSMRLLACLSDRVRLSTGETLCHGGDPSDAVYIVLNGDVEFVREGGDGLQRFGVDGPGAVIGEVGVLCDAERSLTVRAVSDLELLRLDRDSFFRLMHDKPDFSLAVARNLAMRLRTEAARGF
ncbi:cyclic nucleotide-binding domain-containing protein [Zavarzinia compransoris]|uniref:cyclic nucleotide-binding domain-containing protein n=1 Tax=Zavarzinia marina TaxID=2911065 RepID=UPI001F426E63|nr:cyclic nucleotide-binding domain-containing protein [Zavarzinia marina]MCF4167332.1 cyclic nucleotide-binding domain-containing protein [Zavarzinia marina]